jgi:hypothetical protein
LLTLALSQPDKRTLTQGLLFFSSINFLKFFGKLIQAKSPAAQAQIIITS